MHKDDVESKMLIENRIFQNHSETGFRKLALEIFRYQYENNKVYNDYVKVLGVDVGHISNLSDIPYLPISFFKSHKVICGDDEKYELVFRSSATTSDVPSKHF